MASSGDGAHRVPRGLREGWAGAHGGIRVSFPRGFRGGSAGVPRGFRGGSVWVLVGVPRGFRAVPRGSAPKSNIIAAQCYRWAHGEPFPEKYMFSQLDLVFGPWAEAQIRACCVVERPLKIRSCSLFLKLKKGRRRGDCRWSCGSDMCTIGNLMARLQKHCFRILRALAFRSSWPP